MKKAFTNSSLLSTRTLILIGALLSVWNLNLVHAQLTGTKTIPGDYATIALAVDDLNGQGVGAGGVVFNVAAGYTETIAATISVTATGTAANPITFQKSGAGANPVITAYTGGTGTPGMANQDGIFRLVGSDFVTIDGIDLSENAANVANPATMEYGYGLFKASTTDGCQNVTIQNCTITLNLINNASGSGPASDGSRGIDVVNALPTAHNSALVVAAASGSNSDNKFYGNTIQNCNVGIALLGYAAPSPFSLADTNNDVGGTAPATGNTIINYGGAVGATNPAAGVRTLAQYNFNVSYNTINNNDGGGANHASTLRGIFLNTAISASATVNFNDITIKGGGTTSQVAVIENVSGSTAAGNSINIRNNTITGEYLTATTGVFYGIFNSATPAMINIENNTVSNINYSAAGLTGTGVVYPIFNSGASPSVNILGNTVSDIARTGTSGGTTIGIFVSSGTSQTVKRNTVQNMSIDGAGTASTMYGIQTSTGTIVVDSNTVHNLNCLKTTGSGPMYGIYNIASPTNENYNHNKVYDLTHRGTGTTYGIYAFTTTGTRTVSFNEIYNLRTVGVTVAGIVMSSSSPKIFNNKIYNVQSLATGAPTVSGVLVTSLGTAGIADIYNNLIGDLKAPFASSTLPTAPTLRGINLTTITASTSINVSYNTIQLNASTTGANFATTCLFATTSITATTSTLNLRNNILVNLSIPKGTGFTVAYQRSNTTLTNYGAVSDRNIFFAGGPCASRLVFYDGTNALQTLADYKALGGLAPRDANSYTEDPVFLSTNGASANFLHLNTAIATQAEAGGLPIAGITTDFDGNARNGATPDLGADEISGTVAVACAGTPVAGTASAISPICGGNSTTICLSGQSPPIGIRVQWQSGPSAAGPFTDISCAGANCYTTGPLTPGSYFYQAVVTCDNSGLTATSNVVEVVVNPTPTITIDPTALTICSGAGDSLTASGGNTYLWSPATGLNTNVGASVFASPSVTTTYTVVGTSGVGCTGSASVTVTVQPSPSISATATPTSVCSGESSQLQVNDLTANTAATYLFMAGTGASLDPMAGATTVIGSSVDDTPTAAPAGIGFTFNFEGVNYTQYSVSPDGWLLLGGATASSQFTNAVTSATNVPKLYPFWDDLATGTTGNVQVLVSGSAPNRIFIVQWFVTVPRNISGAANSTYQAWLYETTNVIEFRYGVMGVPTSGSISGGITGTPSSNYNSITYSSNTSSNSVPNDVNAIAPPDGTIYTFTPPSLTYSWSPATFLNNPNIANPLASGITATTTYTVTATGGNGCTKTASVTVSLDPQAFNVTGGGAYCQGGNGVPVGLDGSQVGVEYQLLRNGTDLGAPVGGTGVALDFGIQTLAGTYTVEATNLGNACTNTMNGSAVIAVNPLPTPIITATPNDTVCTPQNITLNAGAGYDTYNWSTGAITQSITVNTSGNYGVTVTAAGCSGSASIGVTVSSSPTLSATLTQPTGCISNNGIINLTVSGTVGPFNYNWFTPNGSGLDNGVEDQDSLTVGTYQVTVTAPNGCTAAETYNLNGPGGCFDCPTISSLSATPDSACPNALFTLLAGGLADMGGTYGIQFKYSATVLADPYVGGTVLATVPNAGLGGGGTFATAMGSIPTSGNYFIYAILSPTPSDASCRPSQSISYTIRDLPTPGISINETSGTTPNDGIICVGASVSLTASGGSSYAWSTGALTAGITVFPANTTTYTVTVTSNGGCTATASVTITVNPLPTPSIAVTETSGLANDDGIICAGASATLTASGGTSYSWSTGANTAAITVSPVATTTYTVTVTNANGCTAVAVQTITVNALPSASILVTETSGIPNDGILCVGASATLTASGGTSYLWSTGAATAAITVSPLITTTYTVTVTNANGCIATATRTITVNPLPTAFNVTGGGAVCNTDNVGVPVGLSGSQVGVNYQLLLNGNPVGAPVAGTGAAISFGNQLGIGTYTVVATNATTLCTNNMTGSVTITAFNCNIEISDPCVCLNNATTLTNGQFGETIKINAPNGQVWTVTAINGLFSQFSPLPPSNPFPIAVGTNLIMLGGNMYTLTGIHIDALGYTVTVSNGRGTILSIGNSCQYPNPSITSVFPSEICLNSDPIPLVGNPGDANIVSQTFRVNGVVTNVFDPAQGVGQYTILYTVNGGVPKAFGPNDPGCIQSVSTIVNVVATPSNLNCNNQVYVSLDASCTKAIGADDVLEGSFFCYDDYIVDVDKTLPLGNGPWVPAVFNASDIGKNYQVRVTHLVSGITCWGNLQVEDKLAPALVCENFEIPCNTPNLTPNYLVNTLGIPFAQPTATDCQTITWSYIDTEADEDCASGLFRIITRKWTAVDASGNSATCDQFISLLRPTPADLTLPPNYDGIDAPGFDCGAGTYPSPDWIEAQGLQGYPYVFGFPSGCNINWAYTDVPILICDGTYKVVREWTIVNWCVGTPIKHYQVIKVSDEVGPQLACPADLTVATDPFACCATINLPDVIVTDNCSRINNISGMIVVRDQYTGDVINMVTIGGTLQDFPGNNWWDLDTLANFGWTPCLPVGTHTVTYIAEDDCGNTSACEFELTVRDLVPPVAACDETTTVAIGTDDPFDCYTSADGCEFAGVTWVKATTFDDGSYDNCNDVKFTVRRMQPYSDCINQLSTIPCYLDEFGDLIFSEQDIAKMELDSIKFYCCEVGTTQTIVLTVYQVDVNGNFIVGLDGSPVRNECMIQVEVQDKLRPICQAPAQVNVNCENFDPSLWAYGKADILDNCCLDTSRVYQGQCGLTHTANYALFDTVCNKGTITRTFRAFDCHGQSSQCTQRVIVTYDQDYFVRFPNDVIVTQCDGTGVYGEPTFFGEDCELLGVSFEDEIFTVVPDACFKIERTWKIINWCTFDPNQPFIEVPNPNPNPVTNNPANLPGPIVSPLGTLAPWAPTNVRINPTDPQPTNFSTFYNKNSNGYQYKQIIKIIDGHAPTGTFVVPDCSNQNWLTPNNSQLWNEMYWWDNGIQTHDLCEEPTDLCITATDACSGANVNIEYLLFLDLDGDGIMETVVNSVNTGIAGLGWNNVLYNNLNTPNFAGGTSRQFDERPVPANQKYGFSIQETVNGMNKTACVRWNTLQQQNNHIVPELPHGTHKIKWFITDGCGNNAEYEYTFTVKDCKAPTVVCLNGLSTNIMPTGMITLWASDFLQYTEDNCTPAGQIKIGIRKCGTGTGFPVDANGNPITNVTFDCTELGSQCVELWAIDAAGNADYCETYLIVQDNLGSCVPGNLNVSGVLKTESQEGIEEAVVNIIGTTPAPFSLTTLTDAQGLYQFAGIPQTATFAIAPEKDDNPLNGVTTFDLVLISKHILGLEPLNSPYKMIAADANKSGSITTFDIVEIRKLILGIYTELPNNTSWRFVDKSFSFPNPNNPFQTLFPEVVTVTNALVNQTGEDFTGIKIGDVNGSAVANALMQVDDRNVGTAIFDVSSSLNGAASGDRDLKAGEIFELTFKAAQQLQGFQFTMLHSGLELLEVVKSEGVNAQNFGQFEGKTTVSVDGAQAFTLQFRATKSGKLSEMLGVSGEITRAEGYTVTTPQSPITQSQVTKLGIAFRFGGQTISGVGFELYQNQPNPFVNKTFVGFHLPEAAEATLTVFDETGRVVYQQKGQFAKGENAISLDRALINTTGMLFYKLETATDSATKKMIQAK